MAALKLWSLLKAAFTGWWQDNLPRMGAALAYYTLFAIGPVLILVIGLGGILFSPEIVRAAVVGQVSDLVGEVGSKTIESMLDAAAFAGSSLTVTLSSIFTSFLGVTGAFLELQAALNSIWRVSAKSSGSVLRDLLLQRLMSFGLVLGFAFVLLTALVVSAGLTVLSEYFGQRFPGGPLLWKAIDVAFSFVVITLLFTLIYRVMPDTEIGWREARVGAVFTALLFSVGKTLIGLYLGASSITTSYGIAGSVVVLLVWVYYSSQIVLIGAEFTKAYDQSRKRRS